MKKQTAKDLTPPCSSPYLRGGWVGLLAVLLLITHYPLLITEVHASDKWSGVDESVVEKYAKEHGREAKEPLINTDKGDLLLFVFLVAGAVGGFAGGYYWRMLTENKYSPSAKKDEKPANG